MLLWENDYIKIFHFCQQVNCISTEFTPKKHGGEKGVPFRLMVETYAENTRLHAGVCQVKVFKLKGADRKHKQDREKILKKTPGEQAKLQPSYDCTVLSDVRRSWGYCFYVCYANERICRFHWSLWSLLRLRFTHLFMPIKVDCFPHHILPTIRIPQRTIPIPEIVRPTEITPSTSLPTSLRIFLQSRSGDG